MYSPRGIVAVECAVGSGQEAAASDVHALALAQMWHCKMHGKIPRAAVAVSDPLWSQQVEPRHKPPCGRVPAS